MRLGLFGRKFDHHGLLLPRGPCAPSVSPPTVLGSYVIRLEIVLGSYVKSFNIIVMYFSNISKMSCFYYFFSFYFFFICLEAPNMDPKIKGPVVDLTV